MIIILKKSSKYNNSAKIRVKDVAYGPLNPSNISDSAVKFSNIITRNLF
jgi:hypothetical protein